MQKVIRDGKVAVVYSPDFGAGWSSWNTEYPEIIFDPAIVELVEQKKWEELQVYVTLKYPGIYNGGLQDLEIQWLPEGTEFIIEQYDGAEYVKIKNNIAWITA